MEEEPLKPESIDTDSIREDNFKDEAIEEMSMLPLKHYFDMEPFDQQDEDKLEFLIEWGKENGFKSRGALFKELSRLEGLIGRDGVSERRVSKIFRYIKLNQTIKNLSDERESFHIK